MLPAPREGEPSYFLQRINHHIFRDVEGLQQNIHRVTNHIRAKLQAAGDEDDQDLSRIHVDMAIYNAYKEGYLKEATFLTETERDLLPYGCKRMSYMQAVRFYTDYLNGDTYYKIQYPEHNLVRTRAQMRLLEEQEKTL